MTERERHIDDYINGRLSPEEKNSFEDKMRHDESLRSEVETYLDIQNVLGYTDQNNSMDSAEKKEKYLKLLLNEEGQKVFESIEKAQKDYFETSNKTGSQSKLIYWIIGLIITSSICFLYWFASPEISNEAIFASYRDYSQLPSLTARNSQQILAEAEQYFVNENYQKALDSFSAYTDEESNLYNPQIELYKSCCLIELDKIDEAIVILTKLSDSTSMDKDVAKWFLGQAFLKLEDDQKAIKIFEEISSNTGNFKSQEAKSILKKIQSK